MSRRYGSWLAVAAAVMACAPVWAADGGSTTPWYWWVAPVGAACGLLFAYVFYRQMMAAEDGNETMRQIASYVREGAMAYLKRQYRVVGMVFVVLSLLLLVLAFAGIQNPFVPVAFLSGGFFSGLCGFLGMRSATHANSRTAQGATHSLNRALQVAFRAGAVMGLVVVGFGLFDITMWYLILDKLVFTAHHMMTGLSFLGLTFVRPGTTTEMKLAEITTTMLTFGMGASTQALFARAGGGIYTKAADVGADLVGKTEAGIPEDDPRNPATIADNVGDNVGDVAGMGADLYESYCGAILSTAALGASLRVAGGALRYVLAPMVVAGIGIVLSIIGIYMVRCKEGATQKNLLRALLTGTLGSSALIFVATAVICVLMGLGWGIFMAAAAGLVAGVVIGQSTEYYTSDEYAPTKGVANQARMGYATTIIDGLAVGMFSSGIPVLVTVIAILVAFGCSGGFRDVSLGLYGIGFSAVGMLATLGITLATDAYGPIADNAGGNAEMSHLPPEVRQRTDALDALGNTTAATGKGFAIASAALTAMALLAACVEEVRLWVGRFASTAPDHLFSVTKNATVRFTSDAALAVPGKILHAASAKISDFVAVYDLSLMNPLLLCGIFIGAMMVFVFCAMTMKAVGRAAGAMVDEVRRQFREFPGIMTGTQKPDYARCVDISTAGAQREMIVPSLTAIIVPVLTGLILGVPGVLGLLAGGLTTGFAMACMLNNAGGAWDNAKKYIEKGNLGGKKLPDGSKNPVHAAAVVGDTVGDPCKDTSGPCLNILVKLMSMVAVVFTPVIVKLSPVIQSWLGLTAK